MISEIQTINRLLASVKILEVNGWAKEADVGEYYTTQYIYPVRDIFNDAKIFCVESKLAEKAKEEVRLSNIGRAYLSLGDQKNNVVLLEPNNKQKDFLSRKVFLVDGILDLVKEILYHFNRSSDGTLQIKKEEAGVLENQSFLKLLLQLEILVSKSDYIQLAPQYAELLEKVISRLVVITPEAFEKSEAEKKEIARIAEDYVMQSERTRLKDSGAILQSERVEHIAQENVAAGYDIASFNDENSTIPDRFIEVKAGKTTPIRFFFSRNEFETAKRLKTKYFIYYVCMKDKKPRELFIFTDPVVGVMKDKKFLTQTDTYEVSEK